MNLPYYPGCTLKANASHFESSAVKALDKLNYQFQEMKDWVCCGTVFSLSTDDLMLQLSSIRNLIRAEKQGLKELVVLCSMCYNTLKRSQDFIAKDSERLDKVNSFMYMEDAEYKGTVDILHLLTIIKDRITYDVIREKVTNPLTGLKIGAFYGCLLVRPAEYAIDNYEGPTIIEDLLTTLGAESQDFAYKLECCGAYQTLTQKDVSLMRSYEIINSAQRAGCEAIVTSCPLCAYNLDFLQKDIEEDKAGFKKIPVFYFTELMALALGAGWDSKWSSLHHVDPERLLREKHLL